MHGSSNSKLTTMTKDEMIIRCIAIEEEYDSLENIHLTDEDIEDVSDRYQEKLEIEWLKSDLRDEYRHLNDALGFTKRTLYDKSSRRIN